MTNIAAIDLASVVGGQGMDFNAVRAKAQQYCPATAARYANVNPASLNRASATKMGNECLAEMGPLKALVARGQIQEGIDKTFPK